MMCKIDNNKNNFYDYFLKDKFIQMCKKNRYFVMFLFLWKKCVIRQIVYIKCIDKIFAELRIFTIKLEFQVLFCCLLIFV